MSLAGSLLTLNLSLKKVTAPILNSRPIALISGLSKAFESILNKKIMRYISVHSLLSDCQYDFRKDRSTGDLLDFLTESWSSSFRDFGETSAVGLDIWKDFKRV